mmetsp:Transcript_20289/g.27998  ORF Transcript_20289/g.27998 Transcript_20289/m.27998 type:complete len:170 (+) Transcript_20289:66-575(+)
MQSPTLVKKRKSRQLDAEGMGSGNWGSPIKKSVGRSSMRQFGFGGKKRPSVLDNSENFLNSLPDDEGTPTKRMKTIGRTGTPTRKTGTPTTKTGTPTTKTGTPKRKTPTKRFSAVGAFSFREIGGADAAMSGKPGTPTKKVVSNSSWSEFSCCHESLRIEPRIPCSSQF